MKSIEACCLLLLHPSPSPLLLLFPLNQQKWHWNPPSHLSITASASVSAAAAARAHSFLAQPLYICRARSRKWDPNAESFRSQKLDYGYDEGGGDGGDDDRDDDDENDDITEQWDDVLEEYIDSIWIFKVFGSYGWALPFIIVSLLLATGPKAFLLALALPLGQSTFSFALQKMLNENQNRRKRKPQIKNRSGASSPRFVKRKAAENNVRNQRKKNMKMGYQSWIPQDEGSKDASENHIPSFGGWDELIKSNKFDGGSPKSSDQSKPEKRSSSEGGGLSSSRVTKSDTPLLLRLLLAVFPFLGSWTKMF